ncbi:hypothetical protein QL285_007283 [Trifolium repens]|nr:hypothetical protein QL285_007283 [Trifolium repens]
MSTIPQQDGPPIFHRLYICFDACKRGFKEGCRPMIGLDGCFLKGYFGGQLLIAVGRDANNHTFVIAYAVVDVENKDNWKWFLELLHEDLGDYNRHGWQFVSDMQKGLIPALQEVMPGVEHRFCVMHLWKNFIKMFKDKQLRDIVWVCARSTTPQQFKTEMEKLKAINKSAWDYLSKFPPNSWSRAYFSEQPKMLEEIRSYIMRNMASNKRSLSGWLGELTPVQQKRLDKEKILSNKWRVQWAGLLRRPKNPVFKPVVAVKNVVVSPELVDPMKAYNNTNETMSMRFMPTLGLSRGARNEGPSS